MSSDIRARGARRVGMFLAFILAVAGCSRPESGDKKPAANLATPVTVERVVSEPLNRILTVTGTLYPKDEALVSAEVEGRVEATFVELGDRVVAGQLLAQIDTSSYAAATKQAVANLAKAAAMAENSGQNLKRIEELRKSGISSSSDLDLAVAAGAQDQAEIKARTAAAAVAQLNLDHSRVPAPFDAAVAERLASAGDYVKAGAPLFRVVNNRVLKFIAQAPERYAGEVRKEQKVRLRVDGFPDTTFDGEVYLIGPAVNLSSRAFPFGALVNNPEAKLKANMFARGELVIERSVPTLWVPLEAIVSFAGVIKVFVIEGHSARSREVRTGRILNGRQEIFSGLKADEMVAVSGQTKLYDGAPVRLKGEADRGGQERSPKP